MRDDLGTFKRGSIPWNKGLHKRLNTGRTHFKKGHIPWSTSQKGIHLSPKTEIKKGQHLSQKTEFTSEQTSDYKNIKWKGDKVGYSGLHTWIHRKLGKADECTKCSSIKRVEWSNISYKYKRDFLDWEKLCAKCHRKKDYYSGYWGEATRRFGL